MHNNVDGLADRTPFVSSNLEAGFGPYPVYLYTSSWRSRSSLFLILQYGSLPNLDRLIRYDALLTLFAGLPMFQPQLRNVLTTLGVTAAVRGTRKTRSDLWMA